MKFCVALISLVLCLSLVLGQDDCPTICTADFRPVCGEATIKDQLVRCQFANACRMGASACINKIVWRESNCGYTSPSCVSLV